jgi:hypothetical protein
MSQNLGKMEPSIEKVADRKDSWFMWGKQAGDDAEGVFFLPFLCLAPFFFLLS